MVGESYAVPRHVRNPCRCILSCQAEYLRLCSISRGKRVRDFGPGSRVLASAVASFALVDRVAQHAGFGGLHGVGDRELCVAEYRHSDRPVAGQRRNVPRSNVLLRRGGSHAARLAGLGAVEPATIEAKRSVRINEGW